MSTRSAVLAAGHLVGRPSNVVYTCPAASVVLLKSVYLYFDAPQSGQIMIAISRVSPAVSVVIDQVPSLSGIVHQWQGWVVLEPSDYVNLVWSNNQLYYWLSGAVLPSRT